MKDVWKNQTSVVQSHQSNLFQFGIKTMTDRKMETTVSTNAGQRLKTFFFGL